MKRVRAKWIGLITIDADVGTAEFYDRFPGWLILKKEILNDQMAAYLCDVLRTEDVFKENATVTVTQLHADLYRDEPSEWTKEEATP